MNKSSYNQLASQAIKSISNQRTRDILRLRFGLRNGERQTLEAIGKKYNITRERVRQVEEAAFSDLRKPYLIGLFKPAFCSIDNFLNKEGQIVREQRLLCSLAGSQSPNPSQGALFFILCLGEPYQRFVESDKFHSLWANSSEAFVRAGFFVDDLVKKLESKKEPVPLNFILSEIKNGKTPLPKRALISYLDAAKQIGQDNFGHFGLAKWPQVKPRGVRDKAYIVFRQQNKPLHFREVADLINQNNLGGFRIARPQTVHNELIKDSRFVLVGRGTYGLRDWGYEPGTVREVVSHILNQSGPLTKEQILDKVLKNRLVKANTVLINLQNQQYFRKGEDGKYRLAENS